MKDITRGQDVTVLTVPVRAQELSTGYVVIENELIEVRSKANAADHLNVMLTLVDRTSEGRARGVLISRDTLFNAVVWPTCLANDCVPVKHAQIARDQVTR